MAFPEDPEDLEVGFAFGHSAAEDPTGLSFETVSPAAPGDPGPALAPAIITAGRPGNASTTLPTRVQLGGLRNDDGEFSPLNPLGPRYGDLRRGTPMRLSVDAGGGSEPLATAAQPDWTPLASGPGIDRRVPIDALGVLSLLGRDNEPLSALTRRARTFGVDGASTLKNWWPCESGDGPVTSTPSGMTDGVVAETIAVTVGQPVTVVGPDGLLGASGSLDMSGGASLTAPLHAVRSVSDGGWKFECAVRISSQALGDRITLYAPDGTKYLTLGTAGPSAIGVLLTQGATTNSLSGTATIADGKWHWVMIAVNATVFGTDVPTVSLSVDGVAVSLSGSVTVISNEAAQFVISGVDGLSQIFHWRITGTISSYDAFNAHNGTDQAHARIARLLDEADYPYLISGSDSVVMGPQPVAGLVDLLRECEATDEGMLVELRDGRISYLCRSTLENNTDPWTLSFDDIAGVWPDYSDQFLRNVITARTPDGVTATATATGDLSPDASTGIGNRPAAISRNPYQPAINLKHNAGYALARATQTRPRVHVGINIHGEPQLGEEWLERFIGDRLIVTDLPEQQQQDLGYGDLDVIIVGAEQYLDAGVWTLDLMCEPYELFAVHNLGQSSHAFDDEWVGWSEYDSCVLASGVTSTATSWSITCSPADASDSDNFPRDHYIGGELVTVTASTGGTSPTWTVTRSANGVVKAHDAADPIVLADPLILALS